MNKIILTFLISIFIFSSNAFAIKIGYINVELLLTKSEQFKQSQAALINEFKDKEVELKNSATKIKKMVEKFKIAQEDLTKEEKKEQFDKISKLDLELQQKSKNLKKEFTLRGQDELEKIQELINIIIQEFAKENNFDLVLYQEVAFVASDIDITDKISIKLAQNYKK